jgi:hypothetical protein
MRTTCPKQEAKQLIKPEKDKHKLKPHTIAQLIACRESFVLLYVPLFISLARSTTKRICLSLSLSLSLFPVADYGESLVVHKVKFKAIEWEREMM